MFSISCYDSPETQVLGHIIGKKKWLLTDFQSGEGVVDDADQHPLGLQRVDLSVQEEAALLGCGGSDQHVAPVQIPAAKHRQRQSSRGEGGGGAQ